MSVARSIQTNPANVNQQLVLWSDGRILPHGPQTADPHFNANWDQGSGANVGRQLIVTDWVIPSGYVLDGWGGVHSFGGATRADAAGVQAPLYTPRVDFWHYLVMDPNGTGAGYQISRTGYVYNFGGAPSVTSTMPTSYAGGLGGLGSDMVRGFAMDWATKNFVVLDMYGRIHRSTGISPLINYTMPYPLTPQTIAHTVARYAYGVNYVKMDFARAIEVVNWNPLGLVGYVMDSFAGIWPFGNALAPSTKPYWLMNPGAVDLQVQAYPTNFQYTILNTNGNGYLVTASTAPTVTVSDPTGTITLTSRPTVAWSINDAQGDPQDSATIKIFSSAQYGIGGFDPSTSPYTWSRTTTDPDERATHLHYLESFDYPLGFDVPNGTWRAYVQVTEALGLKSTWSYVQWTQSYTPVAAPVVTATPTTSPVPKITLTGTTIAAHIGKVLHLQYSDDAGVTWKDHRASGAAFSAAGLFPTVSDYETAFKASRSYRARAIDYDPYGAGTWSSTVSATISLDAFWIGSPEKDYTLVADTAWNVGVEVMTYELSEQRRQGVFTPIGSNTAVVLRDPGSITVGNIEIQTRSSTTFNLLKGILDSVNTFTLRDGLGRIFYFALTGDYSYSLQKGAVNMGTGGQFVTAHHHLFHLPVVEVAGT